MTPPDAPLGPPPAAAEARRLTGPNLFDAEPGAVLDATWRAGAGAPNGAPNAVSAALPSDAAVDALAGRWREAFAGVASALGWPAPRAAERRGGAGGVRVLTLFATAPVDQLDAAVDAAECAWRAAAEARPVSAGELEALGAAAGAERRPRLPALLAAAGAHGLTATWDDGAVSVGVGAGSRTWPAADLPDPGAVDWAALSDAPVALVTGSNGKTTTTRLVAAMLGAAGHAVGTTSTDGVQVVLPNGARESLEEGDWAGPGGARLALRDPRVTAAVLETARGGILRRGLAVRRAAAAAVTNIAADHFGDYGVFDLDALADAKLVVARALAPTGGPLVLSADDATLRGRARALAEAPFPVVWVSSDPTNHAAQALISGHTARGGQACVVLPFVDGLDDLADAELLWYNGRAWQSVALVADVALAAGGAARHNLANAATAVPLALALGASLDAVRATLQSFGRGPDDNPGRLETLRVGDVTALVDYAHNPAGLVALLDAARGLGPGRRLLLLGQAGDRDDAALAELARAAWAHGTVDRVQLKEIAEMQRGRGPGEVPAVLRAALAAAGAPGDAVSSDVAATEPEAARRALAWARAGDVLVLPLHVERAAVVAWLRALDAAGWRAGRPVPPPPAA